MDENKINNKIAVISGATGYVGFEVSKSLSSKGFCIAMLYNKAKEEDVKEKISLLYGNGHKAYQCDLSDREKVESVINLIEEEMGDIYISVHAAGIMPKPKQLHLSSTSDLHEQFEMNVFGSFNFLSVCALRLKEHKDGVLIGITTAGVATDVNTKARGAYSVVKFALQGMLVALKEELRHYSVRVYSVAPGFMEGGMNSGIPHAFAEMVRHSSPTKTITNASQVAEKISYLCSKESSNFDELTVVLAPETDKI